MDNVRTRKIKPFEDLTLADDFMFGAVMSEEKNLKPLLEYILNIKIDHISYPERQKVIDVNYESKGIRLDVYCEDDKNTVYSVEMQVADKGNLPKRIRYYHDMIDLNIFDKGEDYRKLQKSFVIFICCFDAFGKDRYMYTFKRQCQEDSSVFLGDDAVSIVLNTKGTVGEINEELKGALKYIDGEQPTSDYADRLNKSVENVKANEKWRRDYMTFAMKVKEENEVAVLANNISSISKLRDEMSNNRLADIFNLEEDQLTEILTLLDKYPDKDEWELAEMILYK